MFSIKTNCLAEVQVNYKYIYYLQIYVKKEQACYKSSVDCIIEQGIALLSTEVLSICIRLLAKLMV